MQENDNFSSPIITPSTKEETGHDEDISREEIIERGIISEHDYAILEKYTLALFERGKQVALKRGLILADTKYEFGKIGNEIYLMDEIHTPDSSRYFHADGFEERLKNNEPQKQLSKEFVREWLIANNFMGKEGQTIPAMSDDWIETISKRYIELYEQLIEEKFIPQELSDEETEQRIIEDLKQLKAID
jgi:phosphoribosylaminoimidazole-succinocarboxamide synthase